MYWLVSYLLVFSALQLLFGNVDARLAAFPVGLALGVAFTALLFVLEKEYGRQAWLVSLRSPRTAGLLLGGVAAGCVVAGSVPQASGLTTSWPFVGLLVALLANLALGVFHRLHTFRLRRDAAFLAVHLGIWLALFGGMAGAGDKKEMRVLLVRGTEVDKAYDAGGHLVPLRYKLRLDAFEVERNPADGSPAQYTAALRIDGEPCRLAVNSPFAVAPGEDVYLMDYDRKSGDAEVAYCVLQIVRQPWKYVVLSGIVLLLAGMPLTLTAKRKGGCAG